MIKLLLALSGIIWMVQLQAQPNTIVFDKYKLDNGLTVILHEDHSTPLVAVSVMYHVGSKNENPNRTGFAHFFEHLLFEGSRNIARGEFDDYIEEAGGMNNANTTNDRTFYYEVLPSNELTLGLWLESERMLHAKVEQVGIETQRQVVKEERRQRIDNRPYGTILENTMSMLFEVHPYRWPVIGSMADLDAAVEADYVNFYNDFYVPENAILSIAGDINSEEAKRTIKQYFSPIPRGGKEIYRPTVVEPPLNGPKIDTVYDNIQLPAVVQGYRAPALGTDDYYAMEMLSTLLSDGQSSRLYKALVDDQQKAVYVGSFPLGLEDPGATIVYGIANMGQDVSALEGGINAQIKLVQDQLITVKEYEKLLNQVETQFISGKQKMIGIAQALANYEMYFGDANLINTELSRYQAVTREDIRDAAKKYLSATNRISLHYLPKASQ